MSMPATRTIRCPGCGGVSLYAPENAYRPFCSARCKNNDFGAWAAQAYRVQAKPDPAEDEPGETFTPNE
jgi:endogenous inhibitor of DNA gyrase (YacG/DUF329 family)